MRALAVSLLVASASFGKDLPNVDAFAASKSVRAPPESLNAFDGHVASIERRLGVPTFFWAAPPAMGTRSPRDLGLSIEQAARRYLFTHAGLYRAAPGDLADSPMVRLHDTGHGAIIASFEKRVGGVSVFRDRLHVAMNQELELVALSGYLSPAALERADFKLAAPTALSVASFELLGTPVDAVTFVEGSLDEAGFRRFSSSQLESLGGRAKKVLYPLPERLVPAWYVELDASLDSARDERGTSALDERGSSATDEQGSSAFVISAEDGAVLSRRNLSESDQFSYRVWAQGSGLFLPDDGPQGITASPHPTGSPSRFDPPFILPSLVTLQNSPISTNDPWLAAGATETTGNNVDAYADLVAPDGFSSGDLRATTTSAGQFDRTYDPALAPNASTAQQQAGIAQLFFNVNQLHDWFYDRGFNEAAGNAQTSNFSRGGAGADSIKAEAQDYGGTNNANMSTPADGARPRMQMYVWVPTAFSSLTATPGGSYATGVASFGSLVFNLTANAVVVDDGVAPGSDGCTAMSGLTGKIAIIDRNACTFGLKANNAQLAGAVGVIIVNNVTSATPPSLPADSTITTVTIPVLSVTQADGATLKAAIASGTVSLTMTRAPVIRRAGELDNTVVGHEWGHYLSNRLISDSAGLSNQQGRSMGEGWSDTVAMLLMVREADLQVAANSNWAGVYAPAAYALGGPGFPDSTYYGIRRYPYSTDFAKNPLTFRHIQNGVALPTGPPSASGGATNAEVHNSGEVWAVTLWECYAALLRDTPRLTFDQARDRMIRYLVGGLKLTPAQPTFTEARDGLLAAVAAADLMDFRLFAAAFARRGLGLRAVSPDRADATHAGVVEDFNTGNQLVFVSAELDDEAFYCDRDGVLDVGERGRLRLTLRNIGVDTLTATTGTITSTTPGVSLTNPTVTFTSSQPFGQATATTEVRVTGLTAPTVINLTITFNDPALSSATPVSASASFSVNTDSVAASSRIDDVETNISAWTFAKDLTRSTVFDWRRRELPPGAQHVWFGIDPSANADISLVSPPLLVAATGNFGVVLNHRFDFEADATINYDGAVIEVSTNAGTSWTDIGNAAAGYTGTLDTGTNPLSGRRAYTGRSAGYPLFTTTTINLGTAFAGQTVQLRLRIGADSAAAGAGWDVDSIAFTGITNTPFPALVADRAICINRPPVANAGPDLIADERTLVTLSSAASTDADNNPLVATWVQVSGRTVTLSNGTFTAPEVTADETFSFGLTVNDGTVNSAVDTVQVTVRQLNRAPVAMAGPAQTVDERSTVRLAGSGSDLDGDALTYAWTQVSGPLVAFTDASSATAQFSAPEIGAMELPVVLSLVVSDGMIVSAPSLLTITVLPVNRAPGVTLTYPVAADERSTVTLTATASDPDGDALTYQWRQTSGPAVTLTQQAARATFIAPEVGVRMAIGFEVVVSDGALLATGSGMVPINDVNRAPLLVLAGESREVPAGEVVQLDASASSDPDGDALSFAWVQTSGAAVTLEGAETSVARFTMPKEGAFTFAVTVSDPRGARAEGSLTFTAAQAGAPKGCGCSSSSGAFFGVLPLVLLALRRRKTALGNAG